MAENEANGIIDILKRGVEEEFQNQVAVNWAMLQSAARDFLSQQASFNSAKLQQQKRTQIVAMNSVAGYENFSSDIIKTAQKSKAFYRALFKFDQALVNYLGEVPKRGIYVFFDSNGRPSTYDMSLEDLANISQGQGRIGKLGRRNLQSIESQIDESAIGDIEHANRGACAAMGVNNRLNRFYERRGKQTVTNKKTGITRERTVQKQGGLLMWKAGGAWRIVKITNQGVTGEAYANFLMTKHKTRQDYLVGIEVGVEPYFSHSLIAKFYKYLSTVTNMSAIVEEDIYTEWGQYAVKGQKAGLPSLEQYIRTAYTVLTSSDEISPLNLKNMLRNEFAKEAQLAPFVGQFLDKDVNFVIEDILKQSGFRDTSKISTMFPI